MQNPEEELYGQEIENLDLQKYGLADLEGKNLLSLNNPDLDRVLDILGNDDISLNVDIPCTEANVNALLSASNCRRCGKCCKPNSLNPTSPGIEVFEDELQAMCQGAAQPAQPYDEVRKNTRAGHSVSYPYQVVKLGFTRWLPLPCPFHDESSGCRVYSARGAVCRAYPIIFTGDDSYMSIRVTCDYGKDILKAGYRRLLSDNPGAEIIL